MKTNFKTNVLSLFTAMTVIIIVLLFSLASTSYAEKRQTNITDTKPWSIEQADPLDGIDCSKMVQLGIEKQENMRASRIRVHCGLEAPNSMYWNEEFKEKDPFFESLNSLFAIGGIDVNVITGTTDPYPTVTQSESTVWGHGDTIFMAYNTSPSATGGAGGYGNGSYSTDNGVTWTRLVPSPFATGHGTNYGDPMVVYNEALSKWYTVWLATGCGGQGMGVWESNDAITWTVGACAHSGGSDDRESLWVDNNPGSPYYGRMYVSWNDFAASQYIYVVYSDNGTAWSAPVQVTTSFIRNVQITGSPGADGTVFIAGMNESGGGCATARINIMYRSTNGGASWTQVYTGPSFTGPGNVSCGYFCAVTPIWRHMGWGQPAVGPANTVHLNYSGAGTGGDLADILYVRSTDNGNTWSAPIRLNQDTTTYEQWMPSMVATSSGQVLASWYDRRNSGGTGNYERWGRISNNGGLTWQSDDVISDVITPQPLQPDPAIQACYCGDYDYHSASGTKALVSWCDGRDPISGNPQQDMFFDQIQLCAVIPNAPTGTTATATAPNQITVTWNPVSGADCYNVYRSVGACPGSAFSIISTCQAGTTYLDNTVSGGLTYSYKTTAVDLPDNCESAFSVCDDALATGNCTLSPNFGSLSSASSPGTSNCQIDLAWNAGSSNCPAGPNLTYHIYRSTNPLFTPDNTNRIAQCVAGTSYSDMGVTYGTVYYYIVRAEDSTITGTGPCNNGNIDTNLDRENAAPVGPTTIVFSDNFESGISNWTVSANWQWVTTQAHSPTHSAWSNNLNYQACNTLTKTALIALPAGSNPVLHFWTYYVIENGFDNGIVHGSSDGTTFSKLTMTPNYPGASYNYTDQACLGTNPQPTFTGSGATWTEYTSDLSAFAGGNFTVRFTYQTDYSVTSGGWWIDDVSVDYGSSCTTVSGPPGRVMNSLTVAKSGSNFALNWTAPGGTCQTTGYGLYRGTLPLSTYSHAAIDCTITANNTTTPQQSGSNYYLIVPLNTTNEGSYGTDSSSAQIPQGSSPCHAQSLTVCN
ncbi:MAG: hypothetical protein A2Y62_19765 [Candidatus Fischerbacteria bacterium RBG_13_37_8]|uniref:Uncharacterized protein n=1 Tax=Candidatus Fischerbacteria bacterium RBG_13_37_8 TaxID=1817863 RepID=A0A1F5VM84_9BACT|nr:MAG: hypothetical protein A2Y62_19765 [Candidatus Fischerbacteria bacterium RBG_13_37_8]